MGWFTTAIAAVKVLKKTGAADALAGAIKRRGDEKTDPAPAVVEAGPAVVCPKCGLSPCCGCSSCGSGIEAPAAAPGAAMVAVLSIPGRLTDEGRARLKVNVTGALRGLGNIRLIALEEGIAIRFYDVRGGEVTAGGAGVVLDLPAWKIDALEALQTAIDAIGPEYNDRAGGPELARGEAIRRITGSAAKLIGIHAAMDPRR